jgi:RecB family endonuclease NucS
MNNPPVWQMISEAINALPNPATYNDIKSFIKDKWGEVNEQTINAQIVVLTVNHQSRIHYPENKRPRVANGRYDVLFSVGRGIVERYDSAKHGIWEICQKDELGALGVQLLQSEVEKESIAEIKDTVSFKFEAHLRDFIISNLHVVRTSKLELYVTDSGVVGKEFRTEDVGIIDILAVDENEHFFVFELKLERGPDKALGQLLRYMGWVKKHLANGKKVNGVIVASKMDTKIKYAVSVVENIELYEYEMNFKLSSTSLSTTGENVSLN